MTKSFCCLLLNLSLKITYLLWAMKNKRVHFNNQKGRKHKCRSHCEPKKDFINTLYFLYIL